MALHFLMPISMPVEQIRSFSQYQGSSPTEAYLGQVALEEQRHRHLLQWATEKTGRTFGDTTGLFAHVSLLSRSGKKWRNIHTRNR